MFVISFVYGFHLQEPYQTLAKCYESYKELSVFEDAVAAKRPDAPALMIWLWETEKTL